MSVALRHFTEQEINDSAYLKFDILAPLACGMLDSYRLPKGTTMDNSDQKFKVGTKVRWGPEPLQWGTVADPKAPETQSIFNLPGNKHQVWVWPNPRLEEIRRQPWEEITDDFHRLSYRTRTITPGINSEVGGWHAPQTLTVKED